MERAYHKVPKTHVIPRSDFDVDDVWGYALDSNDVIPAGSVAKYGEAFEYTQPTMFWRGYDHWF